MASLKDLFVNGNSRLLGEVGISGKTTVDNQVVVGPGAGRISLTSGMPTGDHYGSGSKRGTRICGNGISFTDPYYADNTGNDSAWIRHIENTGNQGYFEIATGDDADSPIYVRQYNTSSEVTHSATLLDGSGNTSFTGSVSASSFNATSARKDKENIKDTDINAIELINSTKIVDFNFKNDEDKNRKVGFIADDTDEVLATKNHNMMDMYNCIGVLMKAVQELSKRVEELEKKQN